jgi:hypothetical protein
MKPNKQGNGTASEVLIMVILDLFSSKQSLVWYLVALIS